jgi:hypothetical protein
VSLADITLCVAIERIVLLDFIHRLDPCVNFVDVCIVRFGIYF